MADDDEGLTDAQINDRFAALEKARAEDRGVLDKILGIVGAGAPAGKPGGADPAASIAEQVRAELARAQGESDAAAAEKSRSDTIAQLQADVAKMREQPPAPPVRRVESFMGWHR